MSTTPTMKRFTLWEFYGQLPDGLYDEFANNDKSLIGEVPIQVLVVETILKLAGIPCKLTSDSVPGSDGIVTFAFEPVASPEAPASSVAASAGVRLARRRNGAPVNGSRRAKLEARR